MKCLLLFFIIRYFSQPEVLNRVPYLFLLLGGVCGALCCIGALALFKPPSNALDKVSSSENTAMVA